MFGTQSSRLQGNARFTVPLILPSKIYYSLISPIIYELEFLVEIPHFPAYIISVFEILQYCHSLRLICHPSIPLSKNQILALLLCIVESLFLVILSQISIFIGLVVSLLLWGTAAIYNHAWRKVKLAVAIGTHHFVSE